MLQKGVPLFVDTFTDDAHYRLLYHADEEDTYDPDLIGGKDLPAEFTIINPDMSGCIDENKVCEYEDNRKINLYSDLKIVEFPNGGFDAPLAPIDDAVNAIPFSFAMQDWYYPNRELRLTDYLDYINQVPTEYKTGTLQALHTSNIIKSIEGNFNALRRGDTFTVKDVPFQQWNVTTEVWETVYKDLEYVLIEIIDHETGRFTRPFEGPSGQYNYDLVRARVYAVDVLLVEVNRILVLNGALGYTYGLPDGLLQSMPGYGESGVHAELYFPDPDPDPYPRNPDNPWISNPPVAYYPITGVDLDGIPSRTNRTQGVTGIILTSQIVDADGMSYGYTGLDAGVTGPSGALDLGISGPVEYANPRTVDDYDVYLVPAGETGMFFSYSEAEYRVQWRNWDQSMVIVALGENGRFEEDPFTLLDDIGDGIKRSFWNVATSTVEHMYLSGTVIEATDKLEDTVAAAAYPLGAIPLTQDQVDQIGQVGDPVVDLPELHLGDTDYQLNRMIIREVLHDNSIRVTEVRHFVPLP